jgi:hypothetical protein
MGSNRETASGIAIGAVSLYPVGGEAPAAAPQGALAHDLSLIVSNIALRAGKLGGFRVVSPKTTDAATTTLFPRTASGPPRMCKRTD